MKTTSYKLPETRPKNKCFLFFSRWLAPLTLAVLGPIHHTWGTQIVQDAFLLLAFLGTLAFSSTLALSASRSSRSLWVLVILIRLFWGINTPSFSEDHYRYLHEGQLRSKSFQRPPTAPAHFTEDEAFQNAKHVNHLSQCSLPSRPTMVFHVTRILGHCRCIGVSQFTCPTHTFRYRSHPFTSVHGATIFISKFNSVSLVCISPFAFIGSLRKQPRRYNRRFFPICSYGKPRTDPL